MTQHGVAGGLEDDHHMPDAEEHVQHHHDDQQLQASFKAPAPLQVPSSSTAAAAVAGGGAAPCSPRSMGLASTSRSPRAALGVPGSPRLSPSGTPAGLGMKAVSLAGLPNGRATPVTTTTATVTNGSTSGGPTAGAARASAAGLRAGLQLFQQQVAIARAASLEASAGSPRDGAGQQQGGLYAGLVLPEGVQWQP
jgi:hypothetical protein